MTTYTYALDTTGTLPANKITNELHVVTAANSRDFYCIVPKLGPFFENGLIVEYQDQQGSVRQLVKNVDYYPSNMFLGASRACAKQVWGSITLLDNSLVGVIKLKQYQTIGGEWVLDANAWTTVLSNIIANPRTTTWEQLTGIPNVFPVVDHPWDLVDMVGMHDTVDAIRAIEQAILQSGGSMTTLLQAHLLNLNNPHGTTKTHVGLGSVQNYGVANIDELRNGAVNKYVTASVLRQRLLDFSNPIQSHVQDVNNPHKTNKSQIGLDFVQNFDVATYNDLITGAANKYLTPDTVLRRLTEIQQGMTNSLASLNQLIGSLTTSLSNVQSNTEYTATNKAVTPLGVWNYLKNKAISSEPGNQLSFRDDGFYFGVTAPPDVASLYIDAVTGNDAAAGTRVAPLRTIQEALSRGPAAIARQVLLFEGQVHYVDPTKRATVRGGSCSFMVYGPLLDAIPDPLGGKNWATQTALDLGTTIQGLQFGVYTDSVASGTWQYGSALIGENNASIIVAAITLIPGAPIAGSPYAVSRDCATFSTYTKGANWTLYNCKLKTTAANQRFFGEAIHAPISIFFLSSNFLEGPGKLAIANSKMMTINNGSTGFTDAQLRAMLEGTQTASTIYSNFNTNLLPS